MSGKRRRLRARRTGRSRATPLVVLVAALIAMVAVVPSQVPDDVAAAGGGTATEVGEGQPASGWGTTVSACDGPQVPGMSYSPPCFAFTGDNGGATSRGVTADTVRITYRKSADQNLLKLLADLGGVELDESNEEMARTAEALAEYFNSHFQLYGRKIELVAYDGRGQLLQEFLGAGQDAATNDSIRVANEIGAFADMTGLSQPYADALYRNQVISVGAPYMSREWFNARRPYAWSNLPDCTAVSTVSAEYTNKRLLGREALFPGGDLAGQPRTMAVIAPNNLEYQQCMDSFEEAGGRGQRRDDAGLLHARRRHAADPGRQRPGPGQGRERDLGVVRLRPDHADVPGRGGRRPGLRARVAGGGRRVHRHGPRRADHRQPGGRAVGPGLRRQPLGRGPVAPDQRGPRRLPVGARRRAVRAVDLIYAQLLTLVLGIQMAGPNLTPETFETGLFAFPPTTGQAGRWDFSPDHYTPVSDLREIWWDPDAVSPFNGRPGTWLDLGTRWLDGELPPGDPEVFP